MRQGGMKPKSHKNGNYWIRADSNSGTSKKQVKKKSKWYDVAALTLIFSFFFYLIARYG